MKNPYLRVLLQRVCAFIPERYFGLKRNIFLLSGLKLASGVRVMSSFRVIGTADVEIGSDSFIGHDVTIYGDGSVVIGSNVDIGPGTTILTGTHLVDFRGIRVAGKGESRSVAIGNGTWICANTTINPGVIVGQGCLVASGTVLYRSLPDGYVARSAAIEVAPLGKRG